MPRPGIGVQDFSFGVAVNLTGIAGDVLHCYGAAKRDLNGRPDFALTALRQEPPQRVARLLGFSLNFKRVSTSRFNNDLVRTAIHRLADDHGLIKRALGTGGRFV